jgi:hypothetical protein
MCDQEAHAALSVNLEFRMGSQKSLNRWQGARPEGGEDVKRVDDAILHQNKAAWGDKVLVDVQLAADVSLIVVTVQQHHNGAGGLGHRARNLIHYFRLYRATDEVCDTRVRQFMHLRDIAGDDPPVTDEVEEVGEKVGRSSTIRPAFNQEGRTELAERLLDRPQVEDVLPDGLTQPRLAVKITGLLDKAREELLIEVPS